ncbi:MAG: (2Fe-2S) ferredoxin domain-containing protein [Acidobacteriota bacterium]
MSQEVDPRDRVYVLVCKGDACSKRGNPERVRVALKQAVRDLPAKSVKVSYVSCLGMCGEGPNVLVCRGDTAYHRCNGSEASRIVDEVRGKLGKADS